MTAKLLPLPRLGLRAAFARALVSLWPTGRHWYQSRHWLWKRGWIMVAGVDVLARLGRVE